MEKSAPRGLVYLDLETTGVNQEIDHIIEVGAVRVDGDRREEFHSLVNPPVEHISPAIFSLCRGITEEGLRRAPALEDIKGKLLDFLGDLPLVCHNARFDSSFLRRELGRSLNNLFLDSLELCCLFKPQFPRHGLGYLAREYLGAQLPEAHRALQDANCTREVVEKLFKELSAGDHDLLRETLQYLQGTSWPWLPFLQELDSGLSYQRAPGNGPVPAREEVKPAYALGELERLLRDQEAWQPHFPGYTYKSHQLEVVQAVAGAFARDRAVFLEAPTGSGKTLAYLVVALLQSVEHQEQVFISTNTKNLQQQIQEELPRIARVLDLQNLLFADMKGMSSYACRARLLEETGPVVAGGGLEPRLARAYLLNWMRRTPSGELEDLSYWFRVRYPTLSRLVEQVRCRREECPGEECPHYRGCFFRKKIREMKASDLCTINHSLLLTWPGHYPRVQRLVIDEAHTLEDRAFEAYTREVSSGELNYLCSRLVQKKDKGYLNYLSFYFKKLSLPLDIDPAREGVEIVRVSTRDTGAILEQLREKRGGKGDYGFRLPLGNNGGAAKGLELLKVAAFNLAGNLENLALILDGLLEEASSRDDDFLDTPLCKQGEQYKNSLRNWGEHLRDCFGPGEENECPYLDYNRGWWSFRIAPLDISRQFYHNLLKDSTSLVMTSATLAQGGSYQKMSRALGFDLLEEGRVVYHPPLEPVYDYRSHSVLALPAGSPPYSDPRFVPYMAGVIAGVARMLGGRTMALFTSLERLEMVLRLVQPTLEQEGITVLGGKNVPRQGALDHFREDRNTVLLGSKSYCEGVDISGPALSCVIIDKLSYPFMGDPFFQARSRYLGQQGINSFQELSLGEAVRTLRQQFGRLLRSPGDRGFVLVLDQLKPRGRYYKQVTGELPGPGILADRSLEEILGQMRRRFQAWGYRLYD